MKKVTAILLAILLIVLFTQCHHHHRNRAFKTYFWTSSTNAENERLYINNEFIGHLPLLNEPPSDENGLKQEALFVHMPSGKYRIVIRNEEGEVKFRETLKLRINWNNKSISAYSDDNGYSSFRKIHEDELMEEILEKE
ncbi:MAG: hypothetical protein HYX40_04050 [Sphingobacteriales bacterium]|nr:hypothetical protein [Sphingobacteriales bacterium]